MCKEWGDVEASNSRILRKSVVMEAFVSEGQMFDLLHSNLKRKKKRKKKGLVLPSNLFF